MEELITWFLQICTLIMAIANIFIPCNNIVLILLGIHIIFASYYAVVKNMEQREELDIDDITFY
jgi:hypothetical protein